MSKSHSEAVYYHGTKWGEGFIEFAQRDLCSLQLRLGFKPLFSKSK